MRALGWTFLPTAICGFALLSYNWARFASVSEFGVHFMLAGERVTELKALSWASLFPHGIRYLFGPGHWDSYFPFFSAPASQPSGIVRYLPWAWLALFACLSPGGEGPGERGGRIALVWALALAFLVNLALLSCFFVTNARYPGDFANAELILAGVGGLALGQRAAVAGRSRITGWALAAIASFSLFFSLAVYLGGNPMKGKFDALARAANWPVFAWQKAQGDRFGGLRLEILLPEGPSGLDEPLIETGRQAAESDRLEVRCLAGNRARLNFVHAGTPPFTGREFDVPADRKIVVEARFGSLLPPFDHPAFSGWSRSGYDAVKRNLRINVNGIAVLRASLECYEASPASTWVGRLSGFGGGGDRAFSGSLLNIERLPLIKPPSGESLGATAAPVELSLYLPAAGHAGADPLLSTGRGQASDLLYCVYDGSDQIRFALDHYGAGGPQSESVAYDPLIPHTLTVWMGSMAQFADVDPRGAADSDRLVVAFDGRSMLNIYQTFYPDSVGTVVLGQNTGGSSQAGRDFTGEILAVRRIPASALPNLALRGSYGAAELGVTFPRRVMGTQEPLAVTGVAGAGDFVYVRYVDSHHVAIGFDHWGIGGLLGEPIEVDYAQIHRLAITMPSLYPPGSLGHASDRVRVLLDGRPALVGKYVCYPSGADRIVIGENSIGGSTCGPRFTGNILSLERIAQPRD
jgi:hypothetical protein